jgi:hypothetical protein
MKLIKEQHIIYKIGKFCCEQLKHMYYDDIITFNEETGQFYILDRYDGVECGFIYCPFCSELIE